MYLLGGSIGADKASLFATTLEQILVMCEHRLARPSAKPSGNSTNENLAAQLQQQSFASLLSSTDVTRWDSKLREMD